MANTPRTYWGIRGDTPSLFSKKLTEEEVIKKIQDGLDFE